MQTILKKDIDIQQNINLTHLINSAAEIIATYYPLKNFIATNPLNELEKLKFDEAVAIGNDFYGALGYPSKEVCIKALENKSITIEQLETSFKLNISDFPRTIHKDNNIINLHQLLWEKLTEKEPQKLKNKINVIHEKINAEIIKYCAAFLDEGQAVWSMPNRSLGFFNAWRSLNGLELNISAEQTIIEYLTNINLSPEAWGKYISNHFAALAGWAAFIKWREKQTNYKWQKIAPISLMDYLATRIAIEEKLTYQTEHKIDNAFKIINKQSKLEEYLDKFNESLQGKIWLEAWEETYRNSLISKLVNTQNLVNNKHGESIDAQLIFCIDTRSEAYRRNIESCGNYNTYGFAGFFGLPISIKNSNCDEQVNLCPVLLKPKHNFSCNDSNITLISQLRYAYFSLKRNITTAFSFVEAIGLVCGVVVAAKTLLPGKLLVQQKSELNKLEYSEISSWDRLNYAQSLLTSIGLTNNFAKIIILCGHGSSTVNNPYASALDCGACGGNRGDVNANLMAEILNDKHVRSELKNKSVNIPEDTLFLAALHNTTTDEITLFDSDLKKSELFDKLKHDLLLATKLTQRERVNYFKDNYKNRHEDIAQVRPEWGLARNASFIIAPRFLTKDIDLESRAFLHSYDYELDYDNSILTSILTAPMVVAQMINMQYYFSSINNIAYGSGSKITHNIVGKIGIMQGNGSDLMHGLPLQSVNNEDDELFHEPLRLTTIVYAPKSKINDIITSCEILKKLFFNQWVNLVAIEPGSSEAFILTKSGDWNKYHAI